MLDMTKIRPFGCTLLVRIPLEGKTKGGIHIPDGARLNRRVEVVAVGPTVSVGVKAGDRVILSMDVFAPPPGSPKGSQPARVVLQNDGEHAYCLVMEQQVLCADDNPEIIDSPIAVSLQ
jgi:hypothetical protein